MLEAAVSAIQNLFGCPCLVGFFPLRLMFLFLGVVMGLALGAIPGLGGLVGLALLLPFTFDMDPHNAFATMIGLISVTSTSDTIPSVLFGVPGTAASQATILDGHPMAKRGEAGRAFGAAYMASMLGGLFGAMVLAVSIPVLRPVVLAFGSPEFFMMGMLGISMVAVLSGSAPIKGLVVGAIGLLVGMVGMDYQIGQLRWTFGQIYLWEGVPLVPVALGIFAIPEIVDLVIKGTRIADVPEEAMKGVMTGIRDTFRHWFLVLRSSAIGVWVGATPGLGGAVVDWFAYGHAVQTEKGARESFGKGDVRGVIAPESANNAKEGGALIPTLAFGVPGSAAMALLLGAFAIQGLSPGPDMLTKNLDITYTMVWSIAIANILGTSICLLLTNQLAKLASVKIHLLAPLVILTVFLASFQSTRHFGDLFLLLIFSLLGWFMKRFGWPRPPLILGLVLSSILEIYLFISTSNYGVAWLGRPIVLTIGALIVASLVYGRRRGSGTQHARLRQTRDLPRPRMRFRVSAGAVFTLVILLPLLGGVVAAREWPIQARLFPWVIGISALCLCTAQLAIDLFKEHRPEAPEDVSGLMDLPVDRGVPVAVVVRRAANIFGWIFGFFSAIWIIGFLISVPLFTWLYLTVQAREKWWVSLAYTGLALVFLFGVFHFTLHIPWPQGMIPGPQETILEWIGG